MANLQQALTSGTQTDKALVYDSDGSAEVHHYKNCYDNDIFNMFTQEEQYTELLEPISEPNQVQQNDSNVISTVSSVELSGETVEQNPAIVEETRAYFESLYNSLAIEVEKVNSVNRKMKETNADLTTELARYKIQKKCLEINQEKYDKLERCQSIQTIHMLSSKPDSLYYTEHKMALGYQNPFYLKQALQKQQSLYNVKVILENHDPPAVYDSKETLQLAQESSLKMKQLNKEIKPTNYAKINQLSEVFVSQKAKSREEMYFSNTSKTASVSKSISIPNEEFSDDTFLSVARKFLNEALEYEIERILKAVVNQDIMSIVQSNSVVDTSNLQTELEQCKYDKISYDKAYNDMQQKIERLQAQLGDFKAQLSDKVSEQKDTTKGTSANTMFTKQPILGKPPSSSKSKLYFVTPFPNSKVIPKVGETNALLKPVTSNSAPSTRESKVMKND
ncbi:hypothetical protein Tco_0425998 [Tanacetum coccineum]